MGACNLKIIHLNCWHTVDVSKTHIPFLDTRMMNCLFYFIIIIIISSSSRRSSSSCGIVIRIIINIILFKKVC